MTAPCPTPRTDEFLFAMLGDHDGRYEGPLVNFARQLERELAAARAMPAGAAIDALDEIEGRFVYLTGKTGLTECEIRYFAKLRAALSPQAPRNQCDGCARGLPVGNSGLHLDPTTDKAIMACTAHLYSPQAPAGACQHIHQSWKKDQGYCDDCGASLSVPLVDAYPPIADPALAVFQDLAAPPAALTDEQIRQVLNIWYTKMIGFTLEPYDQKTLDAMRAAIDVAVRGKP